MEGVGERVLQGRPSSFMSERLWLVAQRALEEGSSPLKICGVTCFGLALIHLVREEATHLNTAACRLRAGPPRVRAKPEQAEPRAASHCPQSPTLAHLVKATLHAVLGSFQLLFLLPN